MSSLLKKLIKAGEISDKCLRCHQQLESRDYIKACEILTALEYQQIHDLDYQDNVQKLAEHSFCRSCATKHPKKVKSYHLELANCPTDDPGAATEATAGHGSTPSASPVFTPSSTASSTSDSTSGSKSGSVRSQETRTESQKREARRTCYPKDLEELARKVRQMGRDTDDFKKRISMLKLEVQTERNQRELLRHKHKELQRQHTQMVGIAATQYAELIADGTARIAKLEHREAELIAVGTARIAELEHRNAYLIADGTARIADLEGRNAYLLADGTSRIAELMHKITGLEAQNLFLQQQLQSERTIDHTDIAMMTGTIKELNAGLNQCYVDYKRHLTPTSRHVIETLEPM